MKEIKLTKGYVALVDNEDYSEVSKYKWSVKLVANSSLVYASRKGSEENKHTRMHRFILGATDPKVQVDHKDRNGLNNQRQNLRTATGAQNQSNAKKRTDNTSGFKGVSWHKQHEKWLTRIQVRGKMLHIGLFTDSLEAACAYDMAAVKYHGNFASTNFAETS